MRYDIEADWILLSTCNYRCSYCFWAEEQLSQRILSLHGKVDRIVDFFNRSGFTWLLHMTGGEPFIFPDFVQLCYGVTRNNFISINTNLSVSTVQKFSDSIDPKRVSFINCALHIQQREKRSGLSDFIRNFHMLQRGGFRSFVSYVMAPSLFERFEKDFQILQSEGILVLPKMMQGALAGRSYPEAYTEAERQAFLEFSLLASSGFCQLQTNGQEEPTINLYLDREFVSKGIPDHRGQLCEAGYRFVRIRENGDIRRCGPQDVLGNIFKGTFQRMTAPSVCNEIECPYFCAKYVLPPMTK